MCSTSLKNLKKKKRKRTQLFTRLGDGRKAPKTETNGRLVSNPQFDSIHSVL